MAELIWQDKYKRPEPPHPGRRPPLPFRTLEVYDEAKVAANGLPPRHPTSDSHRTWRNRLIWGDNQYIMASLLPELAGQIDLIYIDPPFATGGNFSVNIPLEGTRHGRKRSAIAERAYQDTWGNGLDSYLEMMHERLSLMRGLLTADGSIYVHLDWHAGHYVKIMMDEIFGRENFRNEIAWCYRTMQTTKSGWARKHDLILFYAKGKKYLFNLQEVLEPYPEGYQRRFKYLDESGRRFMVRGKGGPFGFGQGDIRREDEAKYPEFTYRQYMQGGSIPKDWWEIEMLNSNSHERVGFDTQKPEALLERIIKASSRPGDLVADFFCGSGTALGVAERLGRRWIGADLSKWAIQITRKRLLGLPGVRPFEILDLGRYQAAKLKERGIRDHKDFILRLYRAESLSDHVLLHGKKSRRLVHIGDPDVTVTVRQIKRVVKECASAGRKSLDILGWDFEPGMDDLAHRIGREHSINLRLVQVPREALEARDPAKAGLRFFHLGRLEIEHRLRGKTLTLALKDFALGGPEHLPKEVRDRAKRFADYIDYWAVDFDYQGEVFHSRWQSFRTRSHRRLETKCSHQYQGEGNHRILVKVVDIFGNEWSKSLNI
ncbi:MAG: DNA methyltransferase [bacterium]